MIQMNKNNHIKKITVSDPNRELNNLLLKVSKKFSNKGDHFILDGLAIKEFQKSLLIYQKVVI